MQLPEMTAHEAKLLVFADTLVGLLRDLAPDGLPSGEVYAHVMGHGIDLDDYLAVVDTLKDMGLVKEEGYFLTAA